MIWSKKIKSFEALLAGSLKNRLKIRTASYRRAYEERGRTWIELDGEEIISFCDFRHENEWRKLGRSAAAVNAAGTYSKSEFGFALGGYLNLDIETALTSGNELIRALAFLDRRVGKRTLERIDESDLGPVSGLFYRLRLECERIGEPVRPGQSH